MRKYNITRTKINICKFDRFLHFLLLLISIDKLICLNFIHSINKENMRLVEIDNFVIFWNVSKSLKCQNVKFFCFLNKHKF